jgi:hypothetical protein
MHIKKNPVVANRYVFFFGFFLDKDKRYFVRKHTDSGTTYTVMIILNLVIDVIYVGRGCTTDLPICVYIHMKQKIHMNLFFTDVIILVLPL